MKKTIVLLLTLLSFSALSQVYTARKGDLNNYAPVVTNVDLSAYVKTNEVGATTNLLDLAGTRPMVGDLILSGEGQSYAIEMRASQAGSTGRVWFSTGENAGFMGRIDNQVGNFTLATNQQFAGYVLRSSGGGQGMGYWWDLDGALASLYPSSNPSNFVTLAQIPAQTQQVYVATAGVVVGVQSQLVATAWQNPAASTNWTWTSDGTNITLTGYNFSSLDVVLPDVLDGRPVTKFSATLFSSNYVGTAIRTISGANISSVGASSFINCLSLSSVSFPQALSFGQSAFSSCTNLSSVSIPKASSFGLFALANCTKLTSVTFSENKPTDAGVLYDNSNIATNYVTNPTATGWGSTFGGRPVVRMGVTADLYTGNGAGLTNVNASTLAGYDIDAIMAVGSTYFFNTNFISYGAITGREASLDVPTVGGYLTYPGPVTNGQYLNSYLIPANQMPSIISKGTKATFEFFGGHTGTPSQDPTLMGDFYIMNTNGTVVQEFESPVQIVPRGEDYFKLEITFTNDVIKDGYAFLLKTRIIDIDGYTGDFTSYFGKPYYTGFSFPKATGVFTPQYVHDAHTNLSLASGAHGGQNVITNNQTGVTLGLASGTTVATATAGSEPVSLDQALSLLSSSSTVYLSPTIFTGGQVGVTNRTLATMYSPTAWTVVYSGAVTAGQYLFSFTAPSNLVTSVLAGEQTARLYMTYAGGGGSTLTCKMEGYIFDPATTNSIEYAETSATFAPAKSGTLPATPFTPIAVIPVATNLTGDLRYQIRIKAITASSVTSVTLWGGSNSISSVSFPVADSVVLGSRGATSIQSANGDLGAYDSIDRKLTMPAITTPISQLTTGAVITVTPTQSKKVYSVATDIPITLTNDFSQLNANCTTNFEWETWINYTSTNALATVWDSRIEWQTGTPDLTVTGLYKFAMSTACGTNISARQVYPTVYPWVSLGVGPKDSQYITTIGFYFNAFSTSITNSYYCAPCPFSGVQSLIRIHYYTGDYVVSNGTFTAGVSYVSIPPNSFTATNSILTTVGTYIAKKSTIYCNSNSSGQSTGNYFLYFKSTAFAPANIPCVAIEARQANVLEAKAFSSGWRP